MTVATDDSGYKYSYDYDRGYTCDCSNTHTSVFDSKESFVRRELYRLIITVTAVVNVSLIMVAVMAKTMTIVSGMTMTIVIFITML